MTSVADLLLQNRDKIEKGADFLGQTSEVLAATVGRLHPVLENVFGTFAKILKNPEETEADCVKEKLESVNQTLDGFQDKIDKISREQQRTAMNKQNFDRENQILNQYERLQDFVNASPQDKQKKMEKFLSYYKEKGGDLNLNALYNAVITENMLETVVSIEQKNTKAVSFFYARVRNLFAKGICAVLGYAALTKSKDGEEMKRKWRERMEDMEKRMKTTLESHCTGNSDDQAMLDMEQLQEKPDSVYADLSKLVLD